MTEMLSEAEVAIIRETVDAVTPVTTEEVMGLAAQIPEKSRSKRRRRPQAAAIALICTVSCAAVFALAVRSPGRSRKTSTTKSIVRATGGAPAAAVKQPWATSPCGAALPPASSSVGVDASIAVINGTPDYTLTLRNDSTTQVVVEGNFHFLWGLRDGYTRLVGITPHDYEVLRLAPGASWQSQPIPLGDRDCAATTPDFTDSTVARGESGEYVAILVINGERYRSEVLVRA